ncbi:MAG TPA: hypothetical protein VM099_04140 [Gemmatimonadaceae bacterium]|nr:hypothetical protein [Gemmatimonadaceae bacterium]
MIIPPPGIPWQVTGNHWLCLPCIHPVDASIHLAGVVHAGTRGAIEFAGNPHFADGSGPPLVALAISVDGKAHPIGADGMVWERELSWLPTFSCAVGQLALRGSIIAPCGKDADLPGAIISVSLENRGTGRVNVGVGVNGVLGLRQHRIQTSRVFDDGHSVRSYGEHDFPSVILEGHAHPGLAAFSISPAETGAHVTIDSAAAMWSLSHEASLAPGEGLEHAFFLTVGAEADGALATVDVMRRRGWRNLAATTRRELQRIEQSTSEPSVDRLINRNLAFAVFTGIARAIDDQRIYPVHSRMPWNGRGLTITDWDALIWLLPAMQLADPGLARELLLRVCELHGHSPGIGTRYLDGAVFAPAFSLESLSSYAIAVDEYIVQTGDDRIVDEPMLAETLYAVHEDLSERRHSRIPLYSTEVNPDGSIPAHAYTAHGNAVAAFALEVLARTLDEKTAEKVQDAESVRASALRHFSVEGADGRARFISSSDLAGASNSADDPAVSLYWLPYFHLVGRDDSLYRRTVKQWEETDSDLLLARCARLIGPGSSAVLDWLRRAPLDIGVAAEFVDAEGKAVGNGGDAVHSAMLAYLAWYAVHALGTKV